GVEGEPPGRDGAQHARARRRASVRRRLAGGEAAATRPRRVAGHPARRRMEARHLCGPRLAARDSGGHRRRLAAHPRSRARLRRPRTGAVGPGGGAHRLRDGAGGVTPLVILLILVGALAHATWNLVAKRSALSGPAFVWLSAIGTAVVLAPVAVV